MSDWSNIYQGIGLLGQTKKGSYDPLREATRNKGRVWREGLGKIGDTLGRIGDKRFQALEAGKGRDFQTDERKAGEAFTAEQAKLKEGYVDDDGNFVGGTDFHNEAERINTMSDAEFDLWLKKQSPDTLEKIRAFLDDQKQREIDTAVGIAEGVQGATFMTPWEKEGYPDFESWREDKRGLPVYKQYGYDTIEEWQEWQREMAAIGININEDTDDLAITFGVYLDLLKKEHGTYFQDPETLSPIGFLQMTPEAQEYLTTQWAQKVQGSQFETELMDMFTSKFREPTGDININLDTALENLRDSLQTTIDSAGQGPEYAGGMFPSPEAQAAGSQRFEEVLEEMPGGRGMGMAIAGPFAEMGYQRGADKTQPITPAEKPYVNALATLAERIESLQATQPEVAARAAQAIAIELDNLGKDGQADLTSVLAKIGEISAMLNTPHPMERAAAGASYQNQ